MVRIDKCESYTRSVECVADNSALQAYRFQVNSILSTVRWQNTVLTDSIEVMGGSAHHITQIAPGGKSILLYR